MTGWHAIFSMYSTALSPVLIDKDACVWEALHAASARCFIRIPTVELLTDKCVERSYIWDHDRPSWDSITQHYCAVVVTDTAALWWLSLISYSIKD